MDYISKILTPSEKNMRNEKFMLFKFFINFFFLFTFKIQILYTLDYPKIQQNVDGLHNFNALGLLSERKNTAL